MGVSVGDINQDGWMDIYVRMIFLNVIMFILITMTEHLRNHGRYDEINSYILHGKRYGRFKQ